MSKEIYVTKRNGELELFNQSKINRAVEWACNGLNVDKDKIINGVILLLRPNIKTSEIQRSLVLSASKLIGLECIDAPYATARLQLLDLYKTVRVNLELGDDVIAYPHLKDYIFAGVKSGILNPELLNFDLEALNSAIKQENDLKFQYLGLTTLISNYLIKNNDDKIIELPQHLLMRVAMGLALKEENKTEKVIEFYNQYSNFDFMSSTPTLFNSGTIHSQLSSCYVNFVADSLSDEEEENQDNRYKSIIGATDETARFSKYAGGIGTCFTAVRGAGARIKGTQGKSSGCIPYIKLYNDVLVAVNQGGKRKGSGSPYLEPWHSDIWAFCELRKNSGDERLRSHDVFPALWIPDLFWERLEEDGMWSLFSPDQAPKLLYSWGDEFKKNYVEYEKQGIFKEQLPAKKLWGHILTNIFETGHPWICNKDESNRRNPQQHIGMVHSSNLCTEIILNTSEEESAVCNLGSINLANHVKDGKPDFEKLKNTITTAVRMLDNVIDINFYPSKRAERSNLAHRPVGLGVMGYHEYLAKLGVKFQSDKHLEVADELFERISYYAIEASCDLAIERGCYPSFDDSLWSKGILPIDTARDNEYGGKQRLDWNRLREKVKKYGIRNSNILAIAPTATIANIIGTTPCIEPPFEIECEKSNMNGPFAWFDPTVRYQPISEIETAFEIDQTWVIKAGAVRQKWICQSQSLNLWAKLGTKGSTLSMLYKLAHKLGLKTTYYLRSQTLEESIQMKNFSEKFQQSKDELDEVLDQEISGKACSINNPNCESCQ